MKVQEILDFERKAINANNVTKALVRYIQKIYETEKEILYVSKEAKELFDWAKEVNNKTQQLLTAARAHAGRAEELVTKEKKE